MDSLRSALRYPSDVSLDHTGRPLLRREHCRLCSELSDRRRDRRFCPCVASARGSLVYSPHGIPPDRRVKIRIDGNVENCRSCRWKSHLQPDGKGKPFPQAANSFTHSLACRGSLHTVPQRLLLRISILSYPIPKRKKSIKKERERGPRMNREATLPFCV